MGVVVMKTLIKKILLTISVAIGIFIFFSAFAIFFSGDLKFMAHDTGTGFLVFLYSAWITFLSSIWIWGKRS